jgi:hypothetical protein
MHGAWGEQAAAIVMPVIGCIWLPPAMGHGSGELVRPNAASRRLLPKTKKSRDKSISNKFFKIIAFKTHKGHFKKPI